MDGRSNQLYLRRVSHRFGYQRRLVPWPFPTSVEVGGFGPAERQAFWVEVGGTSGLVQPVAAPGSARADEVARGIGRRQGAPPIQRWQDRLCRLI